MLKQSPGREVWGGWRWDNCNNEDLQTANIATILAAGEMRGLNFYTFEAEVLQQITHYSSSKRFEQSNSGDFSRCDLMNMKMEMKINKSTKTWGWLIGFKSFKRVDSKVIVCVSC